MLHHPGKPLLKAKERKPQMARELKAQEGQVWKRGTPGERHLQFCIKVTELLVDFYVTVPALQFRHSPLVFISISLVDTVQGCLGDFFILWDNRGVHPAWERHCCCLRAGSPGLRAAGQETEKQCPGLPRFLARVTPTVPTHVSPRLARVAPDPSR